MSANDNCTICHGNATAGADQSAATYKRAPGADGTGVDTAGDSAATDAQVGAHQAHMLLPSSYTDVLNSGGNCNECHIVPANVTDAGHNDSDLPAEAFPAALNEEKADLNSVVPSYGGGTCTVYCHGANMPSGSNNGNNTSPTWNDVNYLTGVAANDCAQCHGAPPNIGPHTGGEALTDCTTCHAHVNAAGDGFDDNSLHIDGIVGVGDNCFDCHSSAGGPTPGAVPDANHAKHIQTAYVGTVSGGDYGNFATNNWYAFTNVGGTPDMKCGYCHPQSDATHMNGSINLNLDPADAGAAGTRKAQNDAVQSFTQNSGVSVTCSSVYCHSTGYDGGSGYGYQDSPDWYGGVFTDIAADKCSGCHGNSPNTDDGFGLKAGSPPHYNAFTRSDGANKFKGHFVGVHYDNIYSGTTGLAAAGATGDDSHGNAVTSYTINCNTCHNLTVTTDANDQNAVCLTCHDGGSAGLRGDAAIDAASATHVNGQPDVAFDPASPVKSKAQLRNSSLPAQWTRFDVDTSGTLNDPDYKTTDARDEAVNDLITDDYSDNTCTVACHNDEPVQWTDAVSCDFCHKALP
jgi:predicted CxxxxCH...CXXCH cytochrome family protein